MVGAAGAFVAGLRTFGLFTAVDLGIAAVAGIRYQNAGEVFRYSVIPNAILSAGFRELFWPYQILDTASHLLPASREGALAMEHVARMTRTQTFMGGGHRRMIDSRSMATMRQRALSDISAAGMTYRNALTNTGRIFHYRYTRQ